MGYQTAPIITIVVLLVALGFPKGYYLIAGGECSRENHEFGTQQRLSRASLLFGEAETQEELDDDENLITFNLYTRTNPSDPEVFSLNMTGTMFENLNVSLPTKIIVHGWNTDITGELNTDMRRAYLQAYDCNYIAVDWGYIAYYLYPISRSKVTFVAGVVAAFIDKLVTVGGVNIDDIHMSGHSLGAHVAGVAGLNVTTGTLPRITAFDPASLLFIDDSTDRLRNESAKFVVVIHSSYWCFHDRLGHVEFYPNKGYIQPGCVLKDIFQFGECSHLASFRYYAQAVTQPTIFCSTACSDWSEYMAGDCAGNNTTYMSEDLDTSTRGMYMLRTSSTVPYGLGANVC